MSSVIGVEQHETTCWCGLAFSFPVSLYQEAQRKADLQPPVQMAIYRPLGHTFVYNPSSEVKRLREALAAEQSRHAQTRARAESAEQTAARQERKLKRVEKGTCPECQRHFVNVARHMKSKHSKAK
jgi:hypothetical protein